MPEIGYMSLHKKVEKHVMMEGEMWALIVLQRDGGPDDSSGIPRYYSGRVLLRDHTFSSSLGLACANALREASRYAGRVVLTRPVSVEHTRS